MNFQILHEDEAVPSYLLRHMCGKLQNLELQGNAVMLIASTRLVGKLVDDPLWFRIFDVNWLVGTLRKGIQSLGYSTDSRFLHLRNTKSYLYMYLFATYHATSA